jgi:hypothetical protein
LVFVERALALGEKAFSFELLTGALEGKGVEGLGIPQKRGVGSAGKIQQAEPSSG